MEIKLEDIVEKEIKIFGKKFCSDIEYSKVLHEFQQSFYKSKSDSVLDEFCKAKNGFNQFTKEFSIGRNLKKEKKGGDKKSVLKILFSSFQKQDIDEVAKKLRDEELSSNSSSGEPILPISFTSKMFFLYRPDTFIPYDTLAIIALKETCQIRNINKDYSKYLSGVKVFQKEYHDKIVECSNQLFSSHRNEINSYSKKLKELGVENFNEQKFIENRFTDKLLWAIGEKVKENRSK